MACAASQGAFWSFGVWLGRRLANPFNQDLPSICQTPFRRGTRLGERRDRLLFHLFRHAEMLLRWGSVCDAQLLRSALSPFLP